MITIAVVMTEAGIYLKLYKFKKFTHSCGLTDGSGNDVFIFQLRKRRFREAQLFKVT